MSLETAKALIDAGYTVRVEESPDLIAPLPHTYIHFAHVFKKQHGWATELSRFSKVGGLLYDLEFLTDEIGRRSRIWPWLDTPYGLP